MKELKKDNCSKNGFVFIQINKTTIKIYSSPSNVNARYYFKTQKPKMLRQFLEDFLKIVNM